MRLAETITLDFAGRGYTLRPTLRAAVVLERAHGLAGLGQKISDYNLTAITDTIAATAYGAHDAAELLERLLGPGGLASVVRIAPALVELVPGLVGHDPDAEEEAAPASDPKPIGDILRELYRIATGKLGWTPAAAWEATPLEILDAWRGRLELLRDIFGGETPTKSKPGSLDDKTRALMQHLMALPGATTIGA